MSDDRTPESVVFEARYWQQVNNDLLRLSDLVGRAAQELIDVPTSTAMLVVLGLGRTRIGDNSAMALIETIMERGNKTMATLAEITAALGSLGDVVGGRVDYLTETSPPPSNEGETT